jgi:hypothetical protein
MLFTVEKTLSAKVTFAALLFASVSVYANQDEFVLEPHELKQRLIQQKRQLELNNMQKGELFVMPSSHYLDVSTVDNYDEYVITVTNQQGFRKQVKNTYGSIDIQDMDLPYDGQYNYEIVAIKNTGEEIVDVINNGRGANASTTMTISKTIAGNFTTKSGSIVIPETLAEPKLGVETHKIDVLPQKEQVFNQERTVTPVSSTKNNTITRPNEPMLFSAKDIFSREEK